MDEEIGKKMSGYVDGIEMGGYVDEWMNGEDAVHRKIYEKM